MKKPRLHISDRAVLRYLQRVKGVDVEALRAEIGRIVDPAEDHSGCSGIVSNGFVYKISQDVVTTVLVHNRPDLRTGRQRKGERR